MAKHCLLISLLLAWFATANAQNKALLQDPDSMALSRNFNTLLPSELSPLLDVNVWFNGSLKAFKYDHLSYNNVLFASIFVHGDANFAGIYSAIANKNEDADRDAIFKQLSQSFFGYKSIFETVYAAVMPHYQAIFKEMTPQENNLFLNFFQAGLDYSKNFDLATEKADLERLGKEFAHNKGKLKAFIYRRIANNQLSKEECIYWLNKIIGDLKIAVNKSIRVEDQYILLKYPEITPNYYWAYLFENGEYKDEKRKIVMQKPDTMGVLVNEPDERILEIIDERSMVVEQANGKQYLLCIEEDKAIKTPLNKKWTEIKKQTIYYEDGTVGLLLPRGKQYKEVIFNVNESVKKVDNQISWRDYATLTYADDKVELMVFDRENGNPTPFPLSAEPQDVIPTEEYLWIYYSREKVELIQMSDFSRLMMPEGYQYAGVSPLKNAFLFSVYIGNSTVDDLDLQVSQGLLSKEAKVLLEPRYYQIISEKDKNMYFFSEYKNGYELWGVLDSNCKEVLAPLYFKEEFQSMFDPETFEEIGYTPPDQRLIFHKPSIKKGVVVAMQSALVDLNGKLIIADKLGYIERIDLRGYAFDSYYLVNNKVEVKNYNHYNDEEFIKKGKFALFDNTGKQLTGFVYDSIIYQLGDDEKIPAYFICTKGKTKEKIDLQGNKI